MSESAVAAEGTVPNAYKHAVRRASVAGEREAEVLARVLDRARTALEAGAWLSTSSAAQDFGAGLHEQRSSLLRLRDEVADEFADAVHREPDEVEPETWRARWR